jgi:hypothetical protein
MGTAGQEEEPSEKRQDYVSFGRTGGRVYAEDWKQKQIFSAGHELPRCNSSSDDEQWRKMKILPSCFNPASGVGRRNTEK